MKIFFIVLGMLSSLLLNAQEPCHSMAEFLSDNTEIMEAITWQDAQGNVVPYADWSEEMKDQLEQSYQDIINHSLDVPNLPEILAHPDLTYRYTVISVDDALKIYLGHVAQSVYVEDFNLVSWSLKDDSPEKINHLFDSKSFYERNGQECTVMYSNGPATLGNPQFVHDFIIKNNIIGSDRKETILRLFEWYRDNVVHWVRRNGETNEDAWLRSYNGYKGRNSISIMIEGVRDSINQSSSAESPNWYKFTSRFAGGCHGSSGFLRGVLRTLNIMVSQEQGSHTGGHNLPVFPELNYFLSHGDDLYSGSNKTIPPYDVDRFLLDYADFDNLFSQELNGSNVSFIDHKHVEEKRIPVSFFGPRCNTHTGDSFNDFVISWTNLDEWLTQEELDMFLPEFVEHVDKTIEEAGGCFSEGYAELVNKPFHTLGTSADVFDFHLNVKSYSKEIDPENRIIRITLEGCELDNPLWGNFSLSKLATAEPLSGNILLDPDVNNKFTVRSEDGNIEDIWQVVFNNTSNLESEILSSNILIYPTPSSYFVHISTDENLSEIELYDLSGKLYSIHYAGENRIDISMLNAGIYFLRALTAEGNQAIKKVIKL